MIFKTKKLWMISLLILLSLRLPAAELIDKEKIVFYPGELTKVEQKLLEDAGDGILDELSLFSAYMIACGITEEAVLLKLQSLYEKKYQEILADIKTDGDSRKFTVTTYKLPAQNLANELSMSMHKIILETYSFDAIFPVPLLNAGQYNCVSSSAVYADLLKRNNISFEFGQVVKHIFLYAVFGKEKILCEPTNAIGFDAGNNTVTYNDGSWKNTPRTTYKNVRLLDETEFIASMYYDGRVIKKLSASGPRQKYISSKLGLYINPADNILQKNFASYTYDYLNILIDKESWQEAETVAIDSFYILRKDKKLPESLLPALAKIGEHYILESAPDSANRIIKKISPLAEKSFSQKLIDRIHQTAAYTLIHSGQVEKALGTINNGLALYPDSKALKDSLKSTEMLSAGKSEDIGEIAATYTKLIKESPRDQRVKNNYIATIYPLLLTMVKTGEIEKVNVYLQKIYEIAGTKPGDRAASLIYGNAINEFYRANSIMEGMVIGRAGLKWGNISLIRKNYQAMYFEYLNMIYKTKGIEEAVRKAQEEIELVKPYISIKQKSADILKPIFEQELNNNNPGAVLKSLVVVKDFAGEKAYKDIITYAFGNASYALIKNQQFTGALDIVEAGLELDPGSPIKDNYVYALQECGKQRIRQKDPRGAMELLTSRMKKFPGIKKIQSLPDVILRDVLSIMLKSGQWKEAESIFVEFEKIMNKTSANAFIENTYLTASYSLIREKKYDQAMYVAEKGMRKYSSPKLSDNYSSAVYNSILSDIDTISYDGIFNKYKTFSTPLKKSNRKNLTYLLITRTTNLIKKGTIPGIDKMLEEAGEYLDKNEIRSMAGNIFINASYTLSQAGKYREAWELADRGLAWNNSSNLVQNYIFAFSRGVEKLVKAGKTGEAEKWLAEAEKDFPNHPVVKQIKKMLP